MDQVLSHKENKVLAITLNRLEKKNALTLKMYQQLNQLLEQATDDDDIHVVTIAGSDRCFSAGNDLADFLNGGAVDQQHPVVQFLRKISTLSKPIIAGVAGPAVGIGTTMLMHCDLVYALDNARFQMPFVPLGLCPEAGASLILPAMMGHQKAAELLLFGEPFGAQQAYDHNLITKVVSAESIVEYIAKRALTLAALPYEAVMQSKRLMKSHRSHGVQQAMVDEIKSFDHLLHQPACQKMVSAILNKQ